eukprot:CAMPEP_0198360802 /NCGR_PEP_ID=MMETSP1450-20131203/139842_1 /TAXON_ID=753684 ORGANISM="Madagascaria erythrocladiodes, Strain CCMP3234" /NCGR_SAMPLE_ID=MMETSP1450 /ASSEMBLY_ACC=CAM_ASM_001115 /LENGTH=41 /DNA_ID= /DNA_START= /DNA_END= /DNA_ORIENTATION=
MGMFYLQYTLIGEHITPAVPLVMPVWRYVATAGALLMLAAA